MMLKVLLMNRIATIAYKFFQEQVIRLQAVFVIFISNRFYALFLDLNKFTKIGKIRFILFLNNVYYLYKTYCLIVVG